MASPYFTLYVYFTSIVPLNLAPVSHTVIADTSPPLIQSFPAILPKVDLLALMSCELFNRCSACCTSIASVYKFNIPLILLAPCNYYTCVYVYGQTTCFIRLIRTQGVIVINW